MKIVYLKIKISSCYIKIDIKPYKAKFAKKILEMINIFMVFGIKSNKQKIDGI